MKGAQHTHRVLAEKLEDAGVTYFSADELLTLGAGHSKKGGGASGLNDYPPDSLLENLVGVARLAQALRVSVGRPFYVLSAYRSPAYNRALAGAASRSMHLRAKALDLAAPGLSVADFHAKARHWWVRTPSAGGLGLYSWGVHVDTGGRRVWTR